MEMTTSSGIQSSAKPQTSTSDQLEPKIRAQGEEIFRRLSDADSGSIFNKDWWYGRIMDWSMRNAHFKTQMFRFVDVLPYLHSSSDVAKHLKEYFAESGEELPSVFNFGLGIGSLAPGLLAGAVKKNVTQMAKMFITGETPRDAIPKLQKGREQSLAFTADLLGEATLSEKEALEYQSRYLELLRDLSASSEKWSSSPTLDTDAEGPIPKVNISVKVSALYSQIDESAFEESLDVLKQRLRPILYLAKELNAFVNLDMEQYSLKELTLELFHQLIMEPELRDYPHLGIVIQAYLRDAEQDIERLNNWARTRGTGFTVRLVKGAYWDYEVIHARQNNWPVPVYMNKKESDANFERCARRLIDNYPHLKLAAGSHNVRSLSAAMVYAESKGLSKNALEVQMLYGMAEPIKKAVVDLGYRVREYATIGELIPGMAYLVRRLLENTSNESFLRSKFAENIPVQELLANPTDQMKISDPSPLKDNRFRNEAPLDFGIAQNRKNMVDALARVRGQLGRTLRPQINGKEQKSPQIFKRFNPTHPEELICQVEMATVAHSEQAVTAARSFTKIWRLTPAEDRARILDKAAQIMLDRRLELSAIEVLEVGKPWSEADADITEAIDFCRYYAREMRRLGVPQKIGDVPGEASHYHYQPRGVSLVIAPWNFPLAILAGMVSASLVTGNTVIMKPAEQSMLIAAELYKILIQAGLPPEALQFLPGFGEEVGAHLVQHKDIDIIAFTGSRAVGLHILKAGAEVVPGQHHIKKCVIEMGGKNAIIIDSDADLDEAISGVLYSAFGFSGQKCSACSRVVVLEPIYDRFLDRLLEAAKGLYVGTPESPQTYMGPVVDDEAYQRILRTIEAAKDSSQLVFQGEVPTNGYFIPPTIFAGVDPQSSLAQEEIFGPVLAVIKAKDFNHAIAITNGTAYGLTGGLFSRSPANIARAREEIEVGNLYINRGNTGALVERHPFGGFKMSGVGSKTGGPDYLLQFMEPRVVTENTMRRGFAPDLSE